MRVREYEEYEYLHVPPRGGDKQGVNMMMRRGWRWEKVMHVYTFTLIDTCIHHTNHWWLYTQQQV